MKHPLLATWKSMLARCLNRNTRNYKNYGGRGIEVCWRWRESFDAFLADMGPRPSDCHSLDRINNDGNYEPGNVRWATRAEQAANSRRTIRVVVCGEEMALRQACKRTGVPYSVAQRRVRDGWDPQAAIDPTSWAAHMHRQHRVVETAEGTTFVAELAVKAGITGDMLRKRLDRGWTLERALATPSQRAVRVERPPRDPNPNGRGLPRIVMLRGQRVPLAQAARDAGLTPRQVRKRLYRGWTLEEALSTPIDA